MVHASGSISNEVKHRCANVTAACNQLRRHVLRSTVVDVATKVSLVSSLQHSRPFYNCQLWRPLITRDERRVNACYVKSYRIITGSFFPVDTQRGSDRQLLQSLDVPACLMPAKRLSYVRWLILSDQGILRRIIASTGARNNSWLAALVSDCTWMCSVRHGAIDMWARVALVW